MRAFLPSFFLFVLALVMQPASAATGEIASTWNKFDNLPSDGQFHSIAVHTGNSQVIYVGSGRMGPGVYKSIDGGNSWQEANSGIEKIGLFTQNYPPISSIQISESDPNVVYFGTAIDDPLFAGGRGDVYRSADAGQSWSKINGTKNWLQQSQIQGSIYSIAVHPGDPNILYVGATKQGVYKTTNGGSSWTKVISAASAPNVIDYFNVISISPTNPSLVATSSFSRNTGDAIPGFISKQNLETFGTSGVVPYGIRVSNDGGTSWENRGPAGQFIGLNPPLITGAYVDSDFGIYACSIAYQTPFFYQVFNKGVFKSLDGGESWLSANNAKTGSLDDLPFYAMHGLSNQGETELFLATRLHGIFWSDDKGASWQIISGLPGSTTVSEIAATSIVIFVTTNTGVYKTARSSIPPNPPTIPAPVVDSVDPRYLTGKPLPQTTRITISGENFTASSRLEFNDGVNAPYTNREPATWNPTELTYDVVSGLEPADWTVKVVDGGLSSTPYAFYVIPPVEGKTLTGLVIEGPATLDSGEYAQLNAKAHYSDASSAYVSASWSENSSSASITSGGRLSANTVSSNREVTISASYTEGGITRSASTVVMIVTSSDSGGSETNDVIVNGGFESGRTPWSPVGYADVAALSYPRSGDWYAYLGNTNNATGAISQFFPISSTMTDAVLEFYLNVSSDETTTTAVFDQMKVSLSTQYDQHVADIATFSNLDKRAPGSYVKKSYNIKNIINAHKGESLFLVFSATTDYSNQTTFRIDDVRLAMTTSTPVSLVDLQIDGDSAVPENGFFAYRAMAVFSDGTTQLVSPDSWSENSSISSINSSGYFYTNSVSTQTTVTVSTSYTYNGLTRNASKQVTVFPLSSPPVLDRLTIEGPGWVDEGSYINFVGKAIFSNGSVQTVTPTWSLSSSWASINSNGRMTTNEVTGDHTVAVGASYTLSGITRTASHEVMIIDGDATPSLDHIEIIGPSTLSEGMGEAYDALAHFTDGSSRYVNPTWSENSSSATITSYGLLSASYVSANTPLTISASYSSDDIQKSATKAVTILDVADVFDPALAITSPSSGTVSASQVVTITGVATDSGYGNNGIASVMVNGAPASGGSVSGGGFAQWSKEVTLVEGSNLIEVVATDGVSNVSTANVEVIWNSADGPPLFSWAKSTGGIGNHRLNGLRVDQYGHVYALIQHEGDFRVEDVSVGGEGMVETALAKFDVDGALRWVLPIQSPEVVVGTGLATTSSGRTLVLGYFGGTCSIGEFELLSTGTRDAFVASVSSSGEVLWARRFGSANAGSADRCFLTSGEILSDGTSVLTGYFLGGLEFGASSLISAGDRDAFVAKLDRNGQPIWISHGHSAGKVRAMKLAVSFGDEIVVGGDFVGGLSWGGQVLSNTASEDGFVAKISALGEMEWLKSIQSPEVLDVSGLGMDQENGIYLSGTFSGSVSHQGTSLTSRGFQDVYLAKLNSTGESQWIRQLGSTGVDLCYDLVCRRDGGVWLTGMFSGQGEFGGMQIGSEGSSEPYIAGYSPMGDELGIRTGLSVSPSQDIGIGTQITADWAGNLYPGGVFTGNIRFGETDLFDIENEEGAFDAFIVKVGDASLEMPRLEVYQDAAQLNLIWPSGWDEWILESTATPEIPASWMKVTTPPSVEPEGLRHSAPTDLPRQFFRLRLE